LGVNLPSNSFQLHFFKFEKEKLAIVVRKKKEVKKLYGLKESSVYAKCYVANLFMVSLFWKIEIRLK